MRSWASVEPRLRPSVLYRTIRAAATVCMTAANMTAMIMMEKAASISEKPRSDGRRGTERRAGVGRVMA